MQQNPIWPRAVACALTGALSCVLAALPGCTASEVPRETLPLVVDGTGLTVIDTNLGYRITVTEARMALDDVVFTIVGEVHTGSALRRILDFILPSAMAHPGHYEGGEITGELRGHFIADFTGRNGSELGMATLLVGKYESVNFTFARATGADGLPPGDPLIGHTAIIIGTAVKAGKSTAFTVIIDSPEKRNLVGAPFEVEITEANHPRMGLRLMTRDPVEGDTLFDDIDFAALDAESDGKVVLAPGTTSTSRALTDAYELVRRTFQAHDHFEVGPVP